MRARAFAIAALLFALASISPVSGETQGNLPVVVTPDLSNLADVDRAMLLRTICWSQSWIPDAASGFETSPRAACCEHRRTKRTSRLRCGKKLT